MIISERGNVVIRDSVVADIVEMQDKLRPIEVAEVWASHHMTPRQGLIASWDNSIKKITVTNGKKIVSMSGIVPDTLLADRVLIWLLTTDEIYNVKIAFLKISKHYFKMIRDRYRISYNYVDARNEECLKWLAWAGANVYPPEMMGPDNMPFHYFEFKGEA